jgi:hypothetical protein
MVNPQHGPARPQGRAWQVDGIEENVARIIGAGDEVRHVPLRTLPAGTREGDIVDLVFDGDRIVSARANRAATEAARRRSAEQTQRPGPGRAHDPGGDIVL